MITGYQRLLWVQKGVDSSTCEQVTISDLKSRELNAVSVSYKPGIFQHPCHALTLQVGSKWLPVWAPTFGRNNQN